MADVQRPTILTVLGVLVIIGGGLSALFALFAVIGVGALFAAKMVGAGITVLIYALFAVASAVVGLMGGIKIMGNKPKGVFFLKVYAGISILSSIVSLIQSIIQGAPGWGSFIGSLIIPGIVLVLLFTQQPIKDYEQAVG